MARKAVIENGVVTNVIELEDNSSWQPRPNQQVVELSAGQRVQTGDTYNGSEFTAVQRTPPNEEVLRERLRQALRANQNYLDLSPPTNAQNAAQLNSLTKQTSALIRIVSDLFDSTSGT